MPPVGTGGILDVQPPAKDLHYRLAAVIEHQGEMRRGHYVAYVSRPVNPAGATAHDEQGQDEAQPLAWYYVSDTDVRPVTEAAVLKAQAYILLYVRCKAALRT
jgi:ubiquitin carboxyl-terminal hydrolase 16/45